MKQGVQEQSDTRYLNLLSVLACLAVVQMHANNCVHRFSATAGYWLGANVIESVCYFAVPVFFMITGATLLDYSDRYSTWEFFRKRLQKTVIPFLFWSVAGICFNAFVLHNVDLRQVGERYWYDGIINAKVITYYWFFPSLFCVYLTMPLFAAVQPEKRKETFVYLAVGGYVLNALIPLLNTVLKLGLTLPLSITGMSSQLIFVVVGYLLAHYEFAPSSPPLHTRLRLTGEIWVHLAALAALAVLFFGTWHVSLDAGSTQRTFKTAAVSVPYASGIFLLAKKYGNRIMDSFVGKIVNFLKDYTFAIYLLQWFVFSSLKQLPFIDDTSLVYRLGAVPVVVAVCIGITWVLRKIPGLRRIVP